MFGSSIINTMAKPVISQIIVSSFFAILVGAGVYQLLHEGQTLQQLSVEVIRIKSDLNLLNTLNAMTIQSEINLEIINDLYGISNKIDQKDAELLVKYYLYNGESKIRNYTLHREFSNATIETFRVLYETHVTSNPVLR